MAQRKFTSEFGLNLVACNSALLQQDKLDLVEKSGRTPHVYVIARRPRISVVPDSFEFADAEVRGDFRKQIGGDYEIISVVTPNKLASSDVTMQSEYPHSEFAIVQNDNGEKLLHGKAALLLAMSGHMYWKHLDLEVLYVGQAYGGDGKRTAADRLQKHETLQGIYAEAMQQNPDQEIWLYLVEFEEFVLAMIDGTDKNVSATEDEDTAHIHKVVHTDISEQQAINFGEAALIRYFEPPYNKIYKNSFPNPAHKTYSECYDLDLNMVSVELDTEDSGFRFWSNKVEPLWTHYCTFPLHSREERRYMFECEGVDLI